MSGFSARWLALREPYDSRARNIEVLGAVTEELKEHHTLHIADLACGTGSTMRAVSPLLGAQQSMATHRQRYRAAL